MKLREDRNGASSGQSELGRGQSDKQGRVGVREVKPEVFAREPHRSHCAGSGAGKQVRNGQTQPVPHGEVVVDTAVQSTHMEICWGLGEPI